MKYCNQCNKEIDTISSCCVFCGSQLAEKKNGSNKSSIISIILFAIVVITNGIFFLLLPTASNDPTGAAQSWGFAWAFLGIIPAIPLLFISTILSIISIFSYFKNKNTMVEVERKKTVLVTINIIQIVLILLGLFLLPNLKPNNSLSTDEELDYCIEDINEMFIDTNDEFLTNEIDVDNVHKFNQLLSYVDSVVGKDNYYIGSLYIVETEDKYYDNYIIKIILKDYIEQYNSWTGSFSANPYLIIFKMETQPDVYYEWHEGMYDNYYRTFILGMKYKEELENEFSSIDSKYKYLVDYNTFLYISTVNLGIDSNSTWQDALKLFKSKSNMPTMLIIAPFGTTEEEGQTFIENNRELFNKYYVRSVSFCVLKENETVTDFTNISKFSSIFETYYSYIIN